MLLNNLLEALASGRQVTFGEEHKNLSPSLEKAGRTAERQTPANEMAAKALFEKYVAGLPSAGLPTLYAPPDPAATRWCEAQFSTDETKAIVTACKAKGMRPTIPFHAALTMATHELAPHPENAYTALFDLDLRPSLDKPYGTTAHPIGVYTSSLPVSVLAGGNFATNTATLKRAYALSLRPKLNSHLGGLNGWFTRATELLTTRPPNSISEPTEPTLNSLGDVDKVIKPTYGNGRIEVSSFWLGVNVLSKQLMFYTWTFRGKLELSVCYNESFYDAAFIDEFMDQVKGVLIGELGLSTCDNL